MSKGPHTHSDFFFGNEVVGYFVVNPPTHSGRFVYMPYRGPGHFHLGAALKNAGPQQCHYVADGKRKTFKVIRIPSYGVLEIEQ